MACRLGMHWDEKSVISGTGGDVWAAHGQIGFRNIRNLKRKKLLPRLMAGSYASAVREVQNACVGGKP